MKNLIFGAFALLLTTVGAYSQTTPVIDYEKQVKKFKPELSLKATNTNDVRLFIYDWFTHFEHAATVDYYLDHLADKDLYVAFPGGGKPLASHSDFTQWYNNLLAQTRWNFHDISAIRIKSINDKEFIVTFIVDWYGEVKSDSSQLAGWQSRKDSNLYHYNVRQVWNVSNDNETRKLVIKKLVVSNGDTPSPIK